ncbi:hypothetical protein QBC34DRAFT_429655 [Podospora aff. communis PSN243]|uniref:Uncharacterized protein n=1 Tax=Podospora aff. communis PSN243 TaxID=3040156 RepID=A0AAV9G9F8_9PEZI|nr:hypothetical protein QBC34DRAFT_429655 [Podospora aff. communis PSN243]
MQFKLATVLLALPYLTAAAPAPAEIAVEAGLPVNETQAAIEARQGCHINSQYRDKWVEYGMQRWRTVFSASGINPETFCSRWWGGDNKQCGWDARVDGGTWRLDITYPRGPAGDEQYWSELGDSRTRWRNAFGCTTG